MGNYTDEEIRCNNGKVHELKDHLDEAWELVLILAFGSGDPVTRFDRLKQIEEVIEDAQTMADGFRMEPYDTPQTAVDIIGQK